ncbi:hypothetical protein L228DRAFT_260024 [Xylona heveae TC161]|uniref:TPR-like protein n=1 Tax=Xylona heveae (strain CBS 132557 / TC161) TaxID=1328760 RepID=A0A165H968_XYLHT|nr:hypothetical protein L228DRAFT_260024 [Xylona heveae TC161]KZF23162.1 hypothetical protein L228DRAFT_260024 [Xylona heveae TC161]
MSLISHLVNSFKAYIRKEGDESSSGAHEVNGETEQNEEVEQQNSRISDELYAERKMAIRKATRAAEREAAMKELELIRDSVTDPLEERNWLPDWVSWEEHHKYQKRVERTDQMKEMTISVIILRVQRGLEAQDWTAAEKSANEAMKLARQLEFLPLVGRCAFWKGLAEFSQKKYKEALASLHEARSCVDVYPEGNEVLDCIMEAEDKWRTQSGLSRN